MEREGGEEMSATHVSTLSSTVEHQCEGVLGAMFVPWVLSTALICSIADVAIGFTSSTALGVSSRNGDPLQQFDFRTAGMF